MTKKKLYRGVLTLLAVGAVCTAAAAPQQGNEPTNLMADSLTYDTRTGLITAETNVRMEQGTGYVEGARATYNTKTEEGTVEGGVRAMRDDMQLSCDRLSGIGQDHWQATGSVHMVKAGRTFTGPIVDYYPSQNEYVLAASGGTMTSADGTFSADHLEGWLKENRFIGTGNAHLVSPPRDLEGGGDRVEYFGMAERPYAVLDGNAWVYQGNNMARSNHMTVYLADDGSAVTE
ncbi:LptA/OstA family protein [uncultured Selenomonas sp.]|uniref:LptA/OstA family protein n=1 Tax=uncultured Selenomonas sp. TaxID=159275 RepID=UPI0028DC4B2D|nr:LptA/OstA family protein [uncultured Selenomonas sp.]